MFIENSNEIDFVILPAMHDDLFHLITPNFNMGFNHFHLYLDPKNDLLHVYDEIGFGTGGTSAINKMQPNLIEGICSELNFKHSKHTKVQIYFPEKYRNDGVGIVKYGYHPAEDKYDFGHAVDRSTSYKLFIEMARKRTV